jgi:hypothetical protein
MPRRAPKNIAIAVIETHLSRRFRSDPNSQTRYAVDAIGGAGFTPSAASFSAESFVSKVSVDIA